MTREGRQTSVFTDSVSQKTYLLFENRDSRGIRIGILGAFFSWKIETHRPIGTDEVFRGRNVRKGGGFS